MHVNEYYSLYTGRGKTIPVSHAPPFFSALIMNTSTFSVPPFLLPSLVPSIFATRAGACVAIFVSHPRNLRSWLLSVFLINLDLFCVLPSPFHAVKLSACWLSVHNDSAREKQTKDKLKQCLCLLISRNLMWVIRYLLKGCKKTHIEEAHTHTHTARSVHFQTHLYAH